MHLNTEANCTETIMRVRHVTHADAYDELTAVTGSDGGVTVKAGLPALAWWENPQQTTRSTSEQRLA